MLALKYLLVIVGIGVLGSAAALVAYDIFLSAQLLRLLRREKARGASEGTEAAAGAGRFTKSPRWPIRWGLARPLLVLAIVPLLPALGIGAIQDRSAAVRVSQMGRGAGPFGQLREHPSVAEPTAAPFPQGASADRLRSETAAGRGRLGPGSPTLQEW